MFSCVHLRSAAFSWGHLRSFAFIFVHMRAHFLSMKHFEKNGELVVQEVNHIFHIQIDSVTQSIEDDRYVEEERKIVVE